MEWHASKTKPSKTGLGGFLHAKHDNMPTLTGWRLTLALNVALCTAQIALGGFHVLGKWALDKGTNPIIFALYREICAGPILFIIALVVERTFPKPRDWYRFVFLGATGVYGNQLLFVLGLYFTSATQAAIMQPCIPVFTTIITQALRMEKFSFLKVAGIIASAAGAVVMVGFDGLSLHSSAFLGTACLIGNTLCTAVYLVYMKGVLKDYPPISITGWAYLVGSVFMGLTSLIFVFQGRTSEYNVGRSALLPLAYSILFATVYTYMVLSWANSKAPASMVSAYMSLQPLTSALLAYFFLHEVLVWREGLGALFIALGLALVTYARVRESRNEEAQAYQPVRDEDNTMSSSPYDTNNDTPTMPQYKQ
eukprot:TRINITY_DN7198_c0_g1_i1.p1 TRINITY_DN7198_c0_g1~~TRINITY_DN7198_c0_g1_i1.p1  ORF type:complete len:366 (+),score=69.06 TRINITY_DN7198_c0_g1_i1:57-1154(+)